MWNKIYLAFLGLSVAVMAFLTFYSWSWLESIGQPQAAVDGFRLYSGIAEFVLWFTALVLLALANGVLWATNRAWAMWLTFIYAAVFLGIEYFWLGEVFFRYKKTNLTYDGSFSLGPVLGLILIVFCGIVVVANQFISVRLHRRMYPLISPETELLDSKPDPNVE